METHDREKIELMMRENEALRRLYMQHRALDEEVARIERKTFLTPPEQAELKRLKRKKLLGVDRMMAMLQEPAEEILLPTGT